MNKSELISKIAEKTGLEKNKTEIFLNAFTDSIIESLVAGDKVQLVGFGTFMIKERSARTGFNPRNGDKIDIPASNTPVFKAGKVLKEAINQ